MCPTYLQTHQSYLAPLSFCHFHGKAFPIFGRIQKPEVTQDREDDDDDDDCPAKPEIEIPEKQQLVEPRTVFFFVGGKVVAIVFVGLRINARAWV